MVHFSDGDYASTVAWCRDPASKVAYHVVIGADGHAEQIIPWELRAWHAGACRPSQTSRHYEDANSAFYGIALAGGPAFGPPTSAQEQTLNEVLYDRFTAHQWPLVEWWRIQGHDTECWPRTRKHDPTGDSHGYGPTNPWLSLDGVREALAATAP